jgi:hypothetical protein
MNPLVLIASVVLVVACVQAKPTDYDRVKRQLPGIPSQYQNINIEQYLRNAKAVQFQLKCVIYEGPCDSIGKYLKRNIPIWLRTQCRNCNEDQKKQAGKLINFFQESYPKEWDDAVKKFAKGTFTDEEVMRFETELGVKVESGGGAPSSGPTKKPDHNALANLAKESIALLKTTKEPIIVEYQGSTTVITPSAKSLEVTSAAPVPAAAVAPSSTAAPAAAVAAAEAVSPSSSVAPAVSAQPAATAVTTA